MRKIITFMFAIFAVLTVSASIPPAARTSYDAQSRPENLEIRGQAGSATTGWAYHANSGLPASKTIAGTAVASFTYLPDGRLNTFTRTVGQGAQSTMNVSYSAPGLFYAGHSWDDGTPAVTVSNHNGIGQPGTIATAGKCQHVFGYNNDLQINSGEYRGHTECPPT